MCVCVCVCMCVCVCLDTDPLTHIAGPEPLCRGMLMFSKETITQQIETERLTETETRERLQIYDCCALVRPCAETHILQSYTFPFIDDLEVRDRYFIRELSPSTS